MKKIITALMLLMLSVPMLRSQSSEEHLKFKGIPITGSKENFIKELKKQGFRSSEYEFFDLDGELTQRSCHLNLLTTPTSNIVYCVIATYGDLRGWDEVKRKYEELKEQLKLKYKVTPKCTESIPEMYEILHLEENAFINNEAVYESKFEIKNGTIAIKIASIENAIFLSLVYGDKEGIAIQKSETNALLQSDL